MKSVYNFLALAFAVLIGSAAAPYTPLQSISNVAALKAGNFASVPQLTLRGYYSNADGGEGNLSYSASPCTEDGVSCFHDGAGNSFIRLNLSGDLRQAGATTGSIYDMDAHRTSPTDATPLITATLAALQPLNLYTVHTNGVPIYLGTSPTLSDYQGLSCDVNNIGPYDTGHYEGHPGTLYTAHGVFPTTTSNGVIDQQQLKNCLLVPEWRYNPAKVSAFSGFSFNYPVQNFADLEAILGNMVKAGDTGIYFNQARNGNLNTLGVYCYDTGIHLKNPNESHIINIRTDANVSIFTEGGGSSTEFEGVHSQNYCTKQVDDAGGHNIPSSENWSIVSIGQGAVGTWGTHQCRLTINNGVYANGDPAPTSDVRTSPLSDQNTPYNYGALVANLTIAGVQNGVACKGYGEWAVNKISDDGTTVVLDLLGSQLGTGADVITGTATWATGGCPTLPACTIIYLKTGDVNSIQAGEKVTATGIPANTLVVGPCTACKGNDPYDGAIAAYYLDHAATIAGSNTAISFDGGAYVQQGECGEDKVSGCFSLDVTQRFFAGTSPGGQFTQSMPSNNGIRKGAAFACDDTVGIKANKMQNFSHHDGFAIHSCNGISAVQQGADDSNKAEDDYDTIGLNLTGSTNKATFQGATGGAGVGANVDFATVSESSSNRTTASSGGTGTGLITITTAGSMSGWAKDADGSLTVALCATLNGSNKCEDGDSGTEYATALVTASTTLKLLDRGQFNTIALALANGWNIVQASVASTAGVVNIGPGGMNVSGDNSIDFMFVHGAASVTSVVVRGGGKLGFITNNFVQSIFNGNLFKDMTIVYDGIAAYNTSSGCGKQFAVNYTWECEDTSPTSTALVIDGTATAIKCDASSGNQTITVSAGSTLVNFAATVTKTDSTSNLCIVTMNSGDTIGGAASAALAVINDALSIKNVNGTTAWIIQ